jgi:hypothetical protein
VELGLIGSTFCIATPAATVVVVTRTSLLAGCFGESFATVGGLTKARVLSPESALSLGIGLETITGGAGGGFCEAGGTALTVGPEEVVATEVGALTGAWVLTGEVLAKLTGEA